MGFKIGDDVAVSEDGEPSRVGRVVGYLGDANFEIAFDGEEPRKVHAHALRHLDSVRMRVAPIKT